MLLRKSGMIPVVQVIRSGIWPSVALLFCLSQFSCSESREVRVQRFLMRGNEMVQIKNFEEAERLFREAIRLDSCFAEAWNNLGTLQFNRTNFEDEIGRASCRERVEVESVDV